MKVNRYEYECNNFSQSVELHIEVSLRDRLKFLLYGFRESFKLDMSLIDKAYMTNAFRRTNKLEVEINNLKCECERLKREVVRLGGTV